MAAAFQHETSRAGDPHLHTHVIVPNRQARADGRLVSLDGTSLFHEARAAGMIYQASLRSHLINSIALEWGPIDPDTGMAEVAGVDRATIKAFSQRSSQLEDWARGNLVLADEEPTAAQLGVAQKATRPRKPESLSRAQLRAGWAADPRGFGIDAEAQRQAREMRRAAAGVDVREVARQAVAGIHTAATFTRADLIEAIAARLPVGAAATAGVSPRELVETLADEVLIAVTAERAPHQREGSVRYTAAELLAEERAIIDLTPARSQRAVIPIRRDDTAALSPDQRAAITNIATSPWLIQPLSAPAGAGKTHSLKALRAAMRRTGGDVLVLAPTHRAVDQAMSEDAGGAGMTIAAALERHRRGTLQLTAAPTLVVVDEAGMVGTQQLRELLTATTEAGVKIVPVGDARQLEPVKARAGTFEQLCTDLPWAQHLSEVWRMRDPDERSASLAVRHGGAAAVRRAVGWYRRSGRLNVGDEVTMADDALAAWRADLDAGRDALLIADRWEVADPLNERIHRDRIDPDAPTVAAARQHRIAAGDLIVTRDSDPTIAIRPRPAPANPIPPRSATATAGKSSTRSTPTTTGSRPAASATMPSPCSAVSTSRKHVHLGYVLTVHVAQGATADTTHALLGVASRLANRRTAYVAMTRGRHTNNVYLYEQPTGERDHEHAPTTTDIDTHTRVRGTTAAGRRRAANHPRTRPRPRPPSPKPPLPQPNTPSCPPRLPTTSTTTGASSLTYGGPTGTTAAAPLTTATAQQSRPPIAPWPTSSLWLAATAATPARRTAGGALRPRGHHGPLPQPGGPRPTHHRHPHRRQGPRPRRRGRLPHTRAAIHRAGMDGRPLQPQTAHHHPDAPRRSPHHRQRRSRAPHRPGPHRPARRRPSRPAAAR
ncbi:MobF family relaxase [Mycobacterium sp. SMC-8]|uniref:MobF family relaxase n=1 Tax=Mycobacterium sp. SMC-8 TaxID=2857060 RepID=UPI0021B3D666|nr:MobF family relaxase [Mycobacterium sp. SMC-8]